MNYFLQLKVLYNFNLSIQIFSFPFEHFSLQSSGWAGWSFCRNMMILNSLVTQSLTLCLQRRTTVQHRHLPTLLFKPLRWRHDLQLRSRVNEAAGPEAQLHTQSSTSRTIVFSDSASCCSDEHLFCSVCTVIISNIIKLLASSNIGHLNKVINFIKAIPENYQVLWHKSMWHLMSPTSPTSYITNKQLLFVTYFLVLCRSTVRITVWTTIISY